jgi:hypothetical protein
VVELCGAMQKIYVSMATVATIGHYGIYVALPQGSVDGPGIADAVVHQVFVVRENRCRVC